MAAEIAAGRALPCSIADHVEGQLTPPEAAKTKLFCTEMQGRVVDRCLQLFGGYGYITEFPIARMYADARVSRIYGGTSEVNDLRRNERSNEDDHQPVAGSLACSTPLGRSRSI